MELQWIGASFVLGLLAQRLGQPPLVGFLVAGFVLELLGLRIDASLQELADVGVLLLLFTIGLKLDVRSVLRPEVWAVTLLHAGATTIAVAGLALGLAATGLAAFVGLGWSEALILGFALSFSSTVFAVKVVEGRDDMGALYARVAIGILVVQDLAAVLFLAGSSGKLPSPWALALLGLVPLRPLLHRLLALCGHGELLVLAGVAAALGGAALFDVVQMKADLGALVAGILLGASPKAKELAHSLLGLKDIFLVGFFLTVGLTGLPTWTNLAIAAFLLLLLPLKGALFFWLLARFRLRARTSLVSGLLLTNYSEFGLIVGALAAGKGWLSEDWLVTIAIALALSFVAAAPINARAFDLFRRHRERLARSESPTRLPDEAPVDVGDATALVFGMGHVGAGAHDTLRARFGDAVVGFDVDPDVIAEHTAAGRRVVLASATDAEFWERLHVDRERVQLVVLALSSQEDNLVALRQLRGERFRGTIAAAARHIDELPDLREAGADVAFHVFAEAGAGFAAHALAHLDADPRARTTGAA